MKYKKLLKKAAVSLLLAQSLIFTGLPIQAADIAGQSMVWMESVEMESAGDAVSAVSSDAMTAEEFYVQVVLMNFRNKIVALAAWIRILPKKRKVKTI